jgi:hypothetical protein
VARKYWLVFEVPEKDCALMSNARTRRATRRAPTQQPLRRAAPRSIVDREPMRACAALLHDPSWTATDARLRRARLVSPKTRA